MTGTELTPWSSKADPAARFSRTILNLVSEIPTTNERMRDMPGAHAKSLAASAARKAAMAAGALALPPGPLGWLTVVPEMLAVWKIQAQVVSDIAALYGKSANLTREHMLYCLFRHTAAQALRDLVVRVGDRVLVRPVTIKALQVLTRAVGVTLTQRAIGKGLSRWLPLVGAAGVGAYAYYDTSQVAKNAIELFGQELEGGVERQGEVHSAL